MRKNLSEAYVVAIDGVTLPITPTSITISNENRNEVAYLASGDHWTIPKLDGPQKISFEFEIPVVDTPLVLPDVGYDFREFTDWIWRIKQNRMPVTLDIDRTHDRPGTHITVLLDEYSYTEDAENGNAFLFSVSFTEYRPQESRDKLKISG